MFASPVPVSDDTGAGPEDVVDLNVIWVPPHLGWDIIAKKYPYVFSLSPSWGEEGISTHDELVAHLDFVGSKRCLLTNRPGYAQVAIVPESEELYISMVQKHYQEWEPDSKVPELDGIYATFPTEVSGVVISVDNSYTAWNGARPHGPEALYLLFEAFRKMKLRPYTGRPFIFKRTIPLNDVVSWRRFTSRSIGPVYDNPHRQEGDDRIYAPDGVWGVRRIYDRVEPNDQLPTVAVEGQSHSAYVYEKKIMGVKRSFTSLFPIIFWRIMSIDMGFNLSSNLRIVIPVPPGTTRREARRMANRINARVANYAHKWEIGGLKWTFHMEEGYLSVPHAPSEFLSGYGECITTPFGPGDFIPMWMTSSFEEPWFIPYLIIGASKFGTQVLDLAREGGSPTELSTLIKKIKADFDQLYDYGWTDGLRPEEVERYVKQIVSLAPAHNFTVTAKDWIKAFQWLNGRLGAYRSSIAERDLDFAHDEPPAIIGPEIREYQRYPVAGHMAWALTHLTEREFSVQWAFMCFNMHGISPVCPTRSPVYDAFGNEFRWPLETPHTLYWVQGMNHSPLQYAEALCTTYDLYGVQPKWHRQSKVLHRTHYLWDMIREMTLLPFFASV